MKTPLFMWEFFWPQMTRVDNVGVLSGSKRVTCANITIREGSGICLGVLEFDRFSKTLSISTTYASTISISTRVDSGDTGVMWEFSGRFFRGGRIGV